MRKFVGWHRLTEDAQRVLLSAKEAADASGCRFVGTEHILGAIARASTTGCIAASILVQEGVNLDEIVRHVEGVHE